MCLLGRLSVYPAPVCQPVCCLDVRLHKCLQVCTDVNSTSVENLLGIELRYGQPKFCGSEAVELNCCGRLYKAKVGSRTMEKNAHARLWYRDTVLRGFSCALHM